MSDEQIRELIEEAMVPFRARVQALQADTERMRAEAERLRETLTKREAAAARTGSPGSAGADAGGVTMADVSGIFCKPLA